MNVSWVELTFEKAYVMLVDFSDKIYKIRENTRILTLDLKVVPAYLWVSYLRYFDQGAYFHHRCQGYVECLRLTGAYSPQSIHYWVTQLVYPAAEHFTKAMDISKEFMQIPGVAGIPQYIRLDNQLSEFRSMAMTIIKYANHLNQISLSDTP